MSADATLAARLSAIEAMLAKLANAAAVGPKQVLSSSEAMELAGFRSASAFHRWASAWRVRHSGNGRWPRYRIETALEKEGHGLSAPRRRS